VRRPYALVYDGDCRMCSRVARVVARWDSDGIIELLPSQSAGLSERFPWISAEAYAAAMQLIAPRGETWQGSAAVEQLLTILPRGKWISWIFRIPFARPIADRVYRWVARNRYRLGCGDHCQSTPKR
jgi:predicted DCC family thiol-disulfide oxidoreductase YuxK